MKLIYAAVFTPLDGEEGYCVTFPDLPGCVTQGDSLENAYDMAVDAASGWILTSIEDGETLPKPSNHNSIKHEGNEFISYVPLDMDEYAKANSCKSIKKTLTIPQWLNTLAEKENINFSRVLQEGIKNILKLSPQKYYETDNVASAQELSRVCNEMIKLIPMVDNFISTHHEQTEFTSKSNISIIIPSEAFVAYGLYKNK